MVGKRRLTIYPHFQVKIRLLGPELDQLKDIISTINNIPDLIVCKF
jgi:hypothetical protein